MTWLIDLVLHSTVVKAILGFLVGWGAMAGYGWKKKREGKAEAKREAQLEDIENAKDIRERVARDLADELRKHEGRGYRDEG